jgi:hypothetical protein
MFFCAQSLAQKKVKFSFPLSIPVFATTALARDDLKPLAVLYKNLENRLMSFYKNLENPCCDARAAPYVSSPVPACSEASFGMPTPEKEPPSFLRLASKQGKPSKQAGAVKVSLRSSFSF